DIGEADQHFRRTGRARRREPLEQPRRAVAAAGTEYRADIRIRERRGELAEASRIIAREISMPLEDSGPVLGAVAGVDQGETGLEGEIGRGACRGRVE